jgi:hypothetical protein
MSIDTSPLLIPGNGQTADNPDEPFVSKPMHRTPGRRTGMTVWSDGTVEHREGTPSAGVIPNAPAAPAPSSSPLRPTFQNASGQPVLAKDVRPETLVVDPTTGEVSSTLGALMAANLIRETKDGWELAGPDGKFVQTNLELLQAQQQQQPSDSVDQQDGPVVMSEHGVVFDEPMMPEHEAAYTAAAETVGETTFAALEAVFTDPDVTEVPETLIGNVARALKVDRDEALKYIGNVAAPLVAQARARVTSLVGDADAVMEWARSDPQGRQLLAEAGRAQLDRRDLSGYHAVTVGYLRHLADTNPEALVAGLREGGTKAKLERGKVLINVDGTWSEFTSALRAGAAKLGGRRS